MGLHTYFYPPVLTKIRQPKLLNNKFLKNYSLKLCTEYAIRVQQGIQILTATNIVWNVCNYLPLKVSVLMIHYKHLQNLYSKVPFLVACLQKLAVTIATRMQLYTYH